jgi:hypothetical protein
MQNGGILFDSEKCANMHPMYNDMKDCKKECWTFMKEKMGGEEINANAVPEFAHLVSVQAVHAKGGVEEKGGIEEKRR